MKFLLPLFINTESLLPYRITGNINAGRIPCDGTVYSGFSARYLLQKFAGLNIHTGKRENLFRHDPLLRLPHQGKHFSLLFQEIQADTVKRSNLHCAAGLLLSRLLFNTLPHLSRCLIGKCNRCDLSRTDFPVFQQIAESGHKRLCLSCTRSCLYRNMR